MAKCEICGSGPEQGVSLTRRNPLGEIGIWRCDEHHCAESFALACDPDVAVITDALKQETQQ